MLRKTIEGILFLTAKEWKVEDLARMLRVSEELVQKELDALISFYSTLDTIIDVRKVGPYYSMNVKPQYIPILKKYINVRELTKFEAKLLGLIDAQPGIKKSLLSKKLGSKIYPAIADLVKRGFVNEVKTGRTSQLYTTQKYKDYKERYK